MVPPPLVAHEQCLVAKIESPPSQVAHVNTVPIPACQWNKRTPSHEGKTACERGEETAMQPSRWQQACWLLKLTRVLPACFQVNQVKMSFQ